MDPHWQGVPTPVPPRSGPPPLPPPRPWDGWYTVLWGAVAIGVWMGVQGGLTILYLLISDRFDDARNFEALMESLMMNEDLIGFITLAGAIVGCPVCYYLGKMRPGFTGAGYLALSRPKAGPFLLWLGVIVLIVLFFNFIAPVFVDEGDIMEVPTSKMPLLLIAGVVIGAPFVEEFIFRGFLWRGWSESPLGFVGTLFLTTVIFTGLHVLQYDLFGLSVVFALGLAMGIARHLTGNLCIPIAMHALNNAIATWEMLRLSN